MGNYKSITVMFAIVHTKVVVPQKCWQLQKGIKQLTIRVEPKMLSIAVLQTKVISCNSANKSCLLQVVHTKAIAALTQFCNFLTPT